MKLKTCLVFTLILLAGILISERNILASHPQEIGEPLVTQTIVEDPNHFELAVQIIKDHEGWHTAKHYPYVGYGHKVLKGEKLDHNISEEVATELVRQDLKLKCAVFRAYGKDSLLLGVLAYNVGEYKLINPDGSPKSTLIRKLQNGNRDIYSDYISFRKAWGR